MPVVMEEAKSGFFGIVGKRRQVECTFRARELLRGPACIGDRSSIKEASVLARADPRRSLLAFGARAAQRRLGHSGSMTSRGLRSGVPARGRAVPIRRRAGPGHRA